jgi:flagellar hook-associated protein 2
MTSIPSTSNTASLINGLTSSTTSATPLQNIGGLASGLDTNSIITQLLSIERQPEVLMQTRQSMEQKRSDTLSAINTQLVALQQASWNMRDVGVWADTQSVTSTDPQNLSATRTSGAAAGGYLIQVQQLARADQLTQTSSLSSAAGDDTLHIQVGSGTAIDVQVSAGDTMDTIAARINSAQGSQVYASVVNGKMVLSGKVTGQANTIGVTSDNGLSDALGFTESLQPKNARFTLDGVLQPESASNTVSSAIPGVTLTFSGVMANPATVNIGAPGPDTSKIASAIQSFVTQYNATVDMISSAINEQKVANPQNAAQQTQGALNSDTQLGSLLSHLRQQVTDMFSGRAAGFSTLSQVGLSTGAAVGSGALSQDSLAGKLTLDTDKLSTALQTNFSDVKSLFTNPADAGLSQRIESIVTPQVKLGGVMAGRIASEATMIADLKQQQADVETRVALKETQLRNQFTAMETAMAQSQAMQQQLAGQIAGLSRSS